MTTDDVVQKYMAAWNEPDAAKRATLLEAAWSDGGVYVDPVARSEGRAGLAEVIAGFHAQRPGSSIVLASGIDQHHDQVRFRWDFLDADGKTLISGIDVGDIADDGRLAKIAGFWGDPPAVT